MRKLSSFGFDEGMDVVADIIVPIGNIALSPAFGGIFFKDKPAEGESAMQFTIRRVRDNLPTLARDHRDDMAAIAARLSGVTVEEYRARTSFVRFINDLLSILDDPDMMELFTSAAPSPRPAASAAASEISKGEV